MENRKVIIDAGHGGPEPGAVYNGRKEKNDTLRLAFDLGSALERRGIQVSYTRVEDVYDTPYEKAAMGNQSGADFFVSIHRNAMPVPGTGSGIENLVFSSSGTAGLLGKKHRPAAGGCGLDGSGRQGETGPGGPPPDENAAVLVEAGFLDNEKDNAFFDTNLAATADAIADGILETFEELEAREDQTASGEIPGFYMVQTGVFRLRSNAEAQLQELKDQGFPAFMTVKDGLFYVRAGAFREMDNAVQMERRLRRLGYGTLITRS